MNIGTNLRTHRLAQSLTQDALAEAIGVCTKTYRKMEAGKTKIAVDALTKAAEALKTTVGALMKTGRTALPNDPRDQYSHDVARGGQL